MDNFAELHLHIEGTLEPEYLMELQARKNGTQLETIDELRKKYSFSDLQDFLNLYYESMQMLNASDDYSELADRYFQRVVGTGLTQVEAFFDPQTHGANGNSFETVFKALANSFQQANDKYGINARLIMCFERDRGPEAAKKTLDDVFAFFENKENDVFSNLLIGVGLDSAEAPFPPAPFAGVYERARNYGLHLVAHAGEEGSPENIWSALDDLGVERIDHGVRALEDEALLKRLEKDRVPLTVCPLSNYALKVVDSKKSAVRKVLDLLDKGIMVTVNSDDPAYFGGYIDDNYELLRSEGVGEDVIELLMQNSLKAAF
ncbi:MAG: adenosine deaminase [Candidatus Ancillula sp.]|jgi:adenosine deaminase|nr:adenosine deaminase [Candidatus Ancillula sp.]